MAAPPMQAQSPTGSASAGPSSSAMAPPPLAPGVGPSSLLPPLIAPLKPPPFSGLPLPPMAPSSLPLVPPAAVSAPPPTAAAAAAPAVQLSAGAARFRRAIEADQAASLSPNYTAPFRSAQDVVQRLLPYHVWNVPHADLAWVLEAGPIGAAAEAQSVAGPSTSQAVGGSTAAGETQEPRRKRRRREDYVTTPAAPDEAFTDAHTSSLWSRFASLQSRAKTLRVQLTGGETTAAFGTESVLQLSRHAADSERLTLATLQEQLRSAREEARQLGYEVRDVDRVVANAKRGFDREQAREARRLRIESGQMIEGDEVDDAEAEAEEARAFSPIKTPLPRPPMQYPSAASPSPSVGRPPFAPAGQSPVGPPVRRGPGRPPNSARPPLPMGVTSIPTAPSTPGSTLPTHPIPLLLPLSSLPSLNALGIYPHPASHLGGSAHVSSPRPPPASQDPPALLLGLSDTMQGTGKATKASALPGVPRKRDYTLHLSVVLGKLAPQQLQGLAAMMQAQSTAPAPTQATIEARGTTETKHQVCVRIAAAATVLRPPVFPPVAGVRPPPIQPGAVATRPPRPPPQTNAAASGSGSTLARPPAPAAAAGASAPTPRPTRGRPKGSGRGPGRPPKNKK